MALEGRNNYMLEEEKQAHIVGMRRRNRFERASPWQEFQCRRQNCISLTRISPHHPRFWLASKPYKSPCAEHNQVVWLCWYMLAPWKTRANINRAIFINITHSHCTDGRRGENAVSRKLTTQPSYQQNTWKAWKKNQPVATAPSTSLAPHRCTPKMEKDGVVQRLVQQLRFPTIPVYALLCLTQ